jgi:hypothetical protein
VHVLVYSSGVACSLLAAGRCTANLQLLLLLLIVCLLPFSVPAVVSLLIAAAGQPFLKGKGAVFTSAVGMCSNGSNGMKSINCSCRVQQQQQAYGAMACCVR